MINQKIYKLAVSLGFLPLCAYAEMCCPLITSEPIENGQVCPGYYYPALFETCGNLDIIVTADFIYWAPQKQLNSYAIETHVEGTTVNNHVVSHHFGYRPGFKVGIGIGLPCFDHVVLNSEYFWFSHTTTSSHNASPGDVITPLPGISQGPPAPQPFSSRATSKWHFGIQMAELTVGRPFYIGQRMILSPAIGLKAVWFRETQAVDFNLLAGGIGTERDSFRSWAVGPYLKIDGKGLLWGGFYVLAKAGVLVLYQRYTHDAFQANFPFANPFQRDFSFGSKKPYAFPNYLESGVGLGWGDYFWCNKLHMDLALTYDYFLANILIHVVFGGNIIRDTFMHGLTLKAQLDF